MAAWNGVLETAANRLQDVTVCPLEVNPIATVMVEELSYALRKYHAFAEALVVSPKTLPKITWMQYLRSKNRWIELYENIIQKWQSQNGNKATFGALFKALDTAALSDAKEEILRTEGMGIHANVFNEVDAAGGSKSFKNYLVYTTTKHFLGSRWSEKWWPHRKPLINSFVERTLDGICLVDQLKEILNLEGQKAMISHKACISGLGGIGKTTLAKWFANKYEDEFDHIIWLDCGEDSLKYSIDRLWESLWAKADGEQSSGLADKAVQCFKAIRSCSTLIIYDNAEEYSGPNGIKHCLPDTNEFPNLKCLITSKWSSWGSKAGYGVVPQLRLETFSMKESVRLLKNSLVDVRYTRIQLEELSELLGHLPLALQIALAHVNRFYSDRENGLTHYIKSLQQSLNSLLLSISDLDDYNKGLLSNIAEVSKLLAEKPHGEVAWAILNKMAYLRSDGVRVSFLASAQGMPYGTALAACELLQRYSLITIQSSLDPDSWSTFATSDKHRISMYRLLQMCIKVFSASEKVSHLSQILRSCPTKEDLEYKVEPCHEAEGDPDLTKEFDIARGELGQLQTQSRSLWDSTDLEAMVEVNHLKTSHQHFSEDQKWMDVRKYKLRELLGYGSSGIVFSADGSDGLIAVKLQANKSDWVQECFLRTCKVAIQAGNHHKNLVKTLRQTNVDGRYIDGQVQSLLENQQTEFTKRNPYLSYLLFQIHVSTEPIRCIEMELCGPTLRGWLNNQFLMEPTELDALNNLRMATDIGADIITGLKFLHSKNILHRDLKPENLLFSFDKSGTNKFSLPIKLADFGQSQSVGTTETTTQTVAVFSELYRAKEARVPDLEGKMRYGENADWFSLGLILYEVFYLIRQAELPSAFDELVFDRNLRPHPLCESKDFDHTVKRIVETVLGLTHRHSKQRTEMIHRLVGMQNVQKYILAGEDNS